MRNSPWLIGVEWWMSEHINITWYPMTAVRCRMTLIACWMTESESGHWCLINLNPP